jgi:hypothetical protein
VGAWEGALFLPLTGELEGVCSAKKILSNSNFINSKFKTRLPQSFAKKIILNYGFNHFEI